MIMLIYCFDAYCGWCYGFSNVIKNVAERYKEKIFSEAFSGGMILPATPVHISCTAGYILSAIPKVEETTGVKFGTDYLWHLKNPELTDWYPHSEKPAIAMSILKEKFPERSIEFAAALQYALFEEGRDLTDDEAYRHLLPQFGLDADEFFNQLHSKEFKEKAQSDFDICRQLQVSGFPAVFIQAEEGKFYKVAEGYTDEATLCRRIDEVLAKA